MAVNRSVAAACAVVLWLTGQAAFGQYGPFMFAPSPPADSAGDASRFRIKVTAAEDPANEAVPVPEPVSASDQDRLWSDWGPQYGKRKGKEEACHPAHDCRVFAEYLYLRPRSAEVPYAVESNLNVPGSQLPPVQTSRIGMVDPDYSSGFRFGFGFALDDCSELVATYTLFESGTSDSIARDPDDAVRAIMPMTIHPATANAVTPTVEAGADYGVDFDLLDIDYRRVLHRSCRNQLFGVVGIRYGHLEQGLFARYADDLTQPVNETEVRTDIDFDGLGLKLGFEGEQYSDRRPVLVYLKGFASLLSGEFDASYEQTVQNNSQLGVDTYWTAGRIVPTFDLEVGAGFYLPRGRLRATIGYAYSVWTNVVKTDDWIHGVQTNDFRGLEDTLTFDGLVLRVEGRF